MEQRVSLITLGVADTAKARRFYEGLGWSGTSPDGELVFFQTGCMIVALWVRDELAHDSTVTDSGGWGRGRTGTQRGVTRGSRRSARTGSGRCGQVGRAGAPTFWGGYSGIFIDPDGHPWEVAHNPGWRLDADGSVHLP